MEYREPVVQEGPSTPLHELWIGAAKTHLNVDWTYEDLLIEEKLRAAISTVEAVTNRVLLQTTFRLYLDCFPRRDFITIPKGQLSSVNYLRYYPATSSVVTWDSSNYEVDSVREPGRLVLAYGKCWPTDVLRSVNGVEIEYIAGWPTADQIPYALKAAVLLTLGDLYMHRESVVVTDSGNAVSVTPTVQNLLSPWILWHD